MSLAYDISRHLHCGLQLRCGREVAVVSLHQWQTYSGWLEGVPAKEQNDQLVAWATRQAAVLGSTAGNVNVLPQQRRDFLRMPGDMAGNASLAGEPAEWLPMVACVAVLVHTRPARDPRRDQSRLVVLWFQDEFGWPIDERTLAEIKSIDWEAKADDVDR